MAKPRFIETEEQLHRAQRVLSMLEHKIKKGIATDEEKARYHRGCEDVAIYDWGTESYQNYVPNQWAAMEERERRRQQQHGGVIARVMPEAPASETPVRQALPPLKKRAVS